jgi:hypothetical protein
LELECEIFACLKLPIQRKFISGLGTEIYEMCAPKIRALLKVYTIFVEHSKIMLQKIDRPKPYKDMGKGT